ncbi:MAG: hypothetical protein ACKORF_05570 [Micrococcales bacterium]
MIRLTRFVKRLTNDSPGDSGAALGMVLIMIVFLSIMVVSISFLTQSSSKSIAINAAESSKRSDLINNAFSQSLNYLADPKNYFGSDGQPCGDIPTKYDVTISCTQAPGSGVNTPLGSLVLVGTGCSSLEKVSGLCVTGWHGGLAINCPQVGCPETSDSDVNRLKIGGGIVNSSSAWENVSPYTMELVQEKGTDEPQLVNQDIQYEPDGSITQAGCPTWNFYSIKCGDVRYKECPVVWVNDKSDPSVNGEYSGECVGSSKLDPTPDIQLPTTKVKNYLDLANSKLAPVVTAAAKTSVSGNVCTWQPGTLSYTRRSGNEETSPLDDLIGQMKSDSPCRTIVFKTGVYVFDSTTPFVWQIQDFGGTNTRTVIGGTAKNGDDCDQTKSGVQFVFSGQTRISLLGGTMSLCSLTPNNADLNEPVISDYHPDAPRPWDGLVNTAFLTVDGLPQSDVTVEGPIRWAQNTVKQGNAGTTSTLRVHGLISAANGALDLNLNQKTGNSRRTAVSFDSGGIFRAARVFEGGGTFATGAVAMPKTYNGDRVVQLKFWRGTSLSQSSRTADKVLGFIQVRIYDYFSVTDPVTKKSKRNSGYKVLTWRAAW